MKFAVVVVLFALAWGAHSSVVPLISSVQGPLVLSAQGLPGSVAIQASAVPAGIPIAVAGHGPVQIISSPAVVSSVPAIVAAHAPAVVAVASPEASYVAKTRGAVHVAPLPGHSQSAASVNLEPAPGTL